MLGRRPSIDHVARVAEVEAPLAGLEEASERDLIRVTQRSIEFVHPLVRAAVHDALGPARLASLHIAAADLADDPDAALWHRAHAATGPDEPLAQELEVAAGQLAASGNWLRAASFLGQAAELSPARAQRERRTLDAVNALLEAGDLVTARSLLPKIREFAFSAEREFVLGRIALSRLDVQTAERHFDAAWTASPSPRLGVWIASELASCAYFRVDARGQLAWAQRGARLTSSMDASYGAAVSKLAHALALAGHSDDGLALLDRARSEPSVDPAQLGEVRGRLRLVNDDLPGARDELTAAMSRGSSRSTALSAGTPGRGRVPRGPLGSRAHARRPGPGGMRGPHGLRPAHSRANSGRARARRPRGVDGGRAAPPGDGARERARPRSLRSTRPSPARTSRRPRATPRRCSQRSLRCSP